MVLCLESCELKRYSFLGSSVVERSAVNRLVVSSNLTRGVLKVDESFDRYGFFNHKDTKDTKRSMLLEGSAFAGKVYWRVIFDPLDITADTRALDGIDRSSCQNCIDRLS
jgi:hypothetical protein